MAEINKAEVTSLGIDAHLPARLSAVGVDQSRSAATGADATAMIPVLEETLAVSKRSVVTGTVRVSTRTETYDDVAAIDLDRSVVDVVRVPVGRVVDVAPDVRIEGDTTIVPVLEERLIVVKQLYLTEELHIRHHVERETSQTSVQLRRQVAVVEHLDASGQIIPDDRVSKP